MDSDLQRQWLALALMPLRPSSLRKLILSHREPHSILSASEDVWRHAGAPQEALLAKRYWHQQSARLSLTEAVDHACDVLSSANAEVIPLKDAAYPPLLAEIHDPPPLLYVAGNTDVLQKPQFAVVGSRRCSATSARAAAEFSAGLVAQGFSICSGLALGIDAAAHRAALQAQGESVAVIATGIDRCYPAKHRGLFRQLEKQGAVISEFPPGTQPRREYFPQRNRVISGLSVGVLVVEAGLASGSLITARAALSQNREVFAVPHSIYDPGGPGCHRLLRDGAGLAESVDDLLPGTAALKEAHQLAIRTPHKSHKPVWDALGHAALSVDELASLCSDPLPKVLSSLVELEAKGFVEQRSGLYQRKL